MSAAGGSSTSRSRTPATGRRSPATSCGSACTSRPTSSCGGFSASSACTISPSRTRATPISGRRSSNTATACSSSPARRRWSTAASPSARRISSSVAATWSRCATARRCPTRRCGCAARHRPKVLSHGEDYILYAILDFIVDNYMPVLEMVEQEVEEIEDHVLATVLSPAEIERLYTLRRDLAAAAQRDRAARRGVPAPRARRDGRDRRRDAAAVPRRHRPRAPGAGGDRFAARGAGLRLRGER